MHEYKLDCLLAVVLHLLLFNLSVCFFVVVFFVCLGDGGIWSTVTGNLHDYSYLITLLCGEEKASQVTRGYVHMKDRLTSLTKFVPKRYENPPHLHTCGLNGHFRTVNYQKSVTQEARNLEEIHRPQVWLLGQSQTFHLLPSMMSLDVLYCITISLLSNILL